MKLTRDFTPIFEGVEAAFTAAVQDVVEEAQRRAPKRTGKFAESIRSERVTSGQGLTALVGSPLASARVKEKGGYMAAQKHSTLFIPAGGGSVRRPEAVRVRAQPTLVPAARKFALAFVARGRAR